MSEQASTTAETIPMREAHRLDLDRLTQYLEGELDGFQAPLDVLQMRAGQSNPTYLLSAGGREWVLRKQPPGELLPSAHAVDREFRIQKALQDSGVPLAHMHLFCEDREIAGTPFYIMERMRGRVFEDNRLPDCTPGERGAIFDAMNETLSRLQKVDYQTVGLGDFGKPGNYFQRQIGRWSKQYQASKQSEIPAMDRLMEWLPEHVPDDERTTIVHGDFRLGNMMFHPDRTEVIAVFDWELSTLGHPHGDLGYNIMPFIDDPDPFGGLAGLDLKAMGIPDQESYVAAYFKRMGEPVIDTTFLVAFSMFRLAAIAEGIMARYKAGIASSAHALEVGKKTRPYAERAWSLIEKKFEI